jgi:uncharacterized protein YhfF
VSERGSTPPALVDEVAAEGFWKRFVATVDGSPPARFTDVTSFGDSAELADKLLALVIDGPKRATAGAVVEYESEGVAIPQVGDRWVACDGRGRPRAVLRTTDVRVGPLWSVDEAFAWDEGEGDRTRADWLRMHRDYFSRALGRLGTPFDDDIAVVFERFELDYWEAAPSPQGGRVR